MVDRQAVLGQRSADRLPHRAPPVFCSACAAMNFTSAGGPVEWDKLEHQPGLRHRHHQPRLRNSLPHGFVSYHPPGRCPRHLDRV